MNNPNGYKNSKKLDAYLVDYFSKHGKDARLATDSEDKLKKFDIVINGKKIDTKIVNRPKTQLWFEVDKHKDSECDLIWYFIDGSKENYCISKDALINLVSDNRRRYQPKTDVLVDFSIDELKEKQDYWRIRLP